MRQQLLFILLVNLLSIAPLSAQTHASGPSGTNQPLATAVLTFQSSDDLLDKKGAEVATLLEAELSSSDHTIMVERQDVEKILGEQELGASGLVSADSAAKIGSLTGAQVLVTGRLFAVGDQYMIVAKIIGTETSRVYGVTTTMGDLSGLPQAVHDLAGKIGGVLATREDVLVAHEESPDQRMQRLKALLGQRQLPSVMVSITEHDYSQPSIDPAAQTEMRMQLQQLGFLVVDADQTDRKADISITGEAYSEFGARHGYLVSSRSRIELKIIRTSSGEVLWTDRETQIAVDVGDRTAGKQALERAASKLIERILPKLTK
jgi:hypothetical protein